MDSVDFARIIAAGNKQAKVDKITKPIDVSLNIFTRIAGSIIFGSITGVLAFVIVLMFADGSPMGEIISCVGLVLGFVVFLLTVIAFNRLLTNTSDKGMTNKKVASSRITETERYERMQKNENAAKTTAGVLRIILRLFGL